jgi:hypothetical protein
MDALASHVIRAFDENKRFRAESIDRLMLEDFRQLNGEYDPEKEADIKRGGQPLIFIPATGEKVRGALAWIMDVINFDNGKPFSLDPSPMPDLSPEDEGRIREQALIDIDAYREAGNPISESVAFQYAALLRDRVDNALLELARDRAKKMESRLYDQMVEGNWHPAFRDFAYNLVWAPAAFIKGPIMRRVSVPKYVQGPFGWYNKSESVIKPTFSTPSPFDMYPSREAVNIDDGELCERINLSPAALQGFKGVPGYQDAAIDKILSAGIPSTYVGDPANTDSERNRLEGKGSLIDKRDFMDGVEYWGSVSGKLLKEKGVTEDATGAPLADLGQYESNVIVVGDLVIYANVNPEISGNRPYAKACWFNKPGSFWGSGVPRLMRELQQVMNAIVRSLCYNMGQAAGFQTIINDMNRIAPGEKVTEAFVGKVWQFLKSTYGGNVSEKPVDFWQPAMIAPALLSTYEFFEPKCDTITGVPRYSMGNDTNGNSSRTLGGLSILMSNAARGIKLVLANIDTDIYRRVVQKMFDNEMLYGKDESIKGDVVIQCSGALSQIVNEQNSQKLLAFLQATANPIDAGAVSLVERGNVLREFAKSLNLPKDAAVKSSDAIKAVLAQQEQAAQAEQMSQQAGQGGQPQQVVGGQ